MLCLVFFESEILFKVASHCLTTCWSNLDFHLGGRALKPNKGNKPLRFIAIACATFYAWPLNPTFRPRGPKPDFPLIVNGKTFKSGRRSLNASIVVFASNLEVDMIKTIVQSIESKHFVIFKIWGGSFDSPAGRTHFRKAHQRQKRIKLLYFHDVSMNFVPTRNVADVCTKKSLRQNRSVGKRWSAYPEQLLHWKSFQCIAEEQRTGKYTSG